MKRLLLSILLGLLFSCSAYSETSSGFEKLVRDYASVKTIKGKIIQYIYSGSFVEKFEGDYTAGNAGFFRIDYSLPEKQIVINNSNGLFWHYPDRRILFLKNRKDYIESATSFLPGNPSTDTLKNVRVVYEGIRFYPLFNYSNVYSFKTSDADRIVRIWIDGSGKFVRKKYVIDSEGYEIIKEIYHEHFKSGEIYIPSKIDLFIRTSGGVIHTLTEYSNITINGNVDSKLFEFKIPANTEVRTINEF